MCVASARAGLAALHDHFEFVVEEGEDDETSRPLADAMREAVTDGRTYLRTARIGRVAVSRSPPPAASEALLASARAWAAETRREKRIRALTRRHRSKAERRAMRAIVDAWRWEVLTSKSTKEAPLDDDGIRGGGEGGGGAPPAAVEEARVSLRVCVIRPRRERRSFIAKKRRRRRRRRGPSS